jgi:hypothetical protein
LATGKFNSASAAANKIIVEDASQDSGTNQSKQPSQGRTNKLPQDFNLNMAESQISIDFDISDSKNNFLTQFSMQQHSKQLINNNNSDGNLGEWSRHHF